MPLKLVEVVAGAKVMEALFALERRYPRAGKSILDTFFQGQFRPGEAEEWEDLTLEAVVYDAEKDKKVKGAKLKELCDQYSLPVQSTPSKLPATVAPQASAGSQQPASPSAHSANGTAVGVGNSIKTPAITTSQVTMSAAVSTHEAISDDDQKRLDKARNDADDAAALLETARQAAKKSREKAGHKSKPADNRASVQKAKERTPNFYT